MFRERKRNNAGYRLTSPDTLAKHARVLYDWAALSCADSVVDDAGQPTPAPCRFWIVTSAAWIRAAWSCFELPVGKLTATDGLRRHMVSTSGRHERNRDALVDGLASLDVGGQRGDVGVLVGRAGAGHLDGLAIGAVHRAVAVTSAYMRI